MAAKAQHDSDYLSLPNLLKTLRNEAGLTQRQLGAKLGKPQSWIYNCEVANRRVDVTEFIRCDYTGRCFTCLNARSTWLKFGSEGWLLKGMGVEQG
jgi:hypothetical protein